MDSGLKPGLTYHFDFQIPENRTVPHLFPEIAEGQRMPRVLATGFLVGLFEFACIKAVNPHIDWPREQTVGIRIDVSHKAATPPGMTVRLTVTLERVEGRKLSFSLSAHDGLDLISEGTHERFVIDAEKFNAAVAAKAARFQKAER